MNEIPTPESDVVWSEYLKSNYCTKDVEKLRKLHCDLERRLTIARGALKKFEECFDCHECTGTAEDALNRTASKL